jgi:hypothetical protein
MRWLSPPDSVPDARKGQIIQPNIHQERRRSLISFRIFSSDLKLLLLEFFIQT